MTAERRVLMLGLDAADREVVRALAKEGQLPNLKKLIDEGVSGPLRSPAEHYAGGVWPTFYTGSPVPAHGVFHNKLWRPETMRVEVPDDAWLDARPFWESLSEAGIPCCIVDVPMVLGQPRRIEGVSLAGWGTHDLICKGSWPADLWSDLERCHGEPRMPREHFGRQSRQSLAALSATLRDTTDQLCDVGLDLLGRQWWRFACIVFGAIHRAGHYLHDLSQLESQDDPQNVRLRAALAETYRSVDAAVGRILQAVPDDTLVIAFSTHGMGPNPGWSDLFPDVLAKLQACESGTAPKRGFLYTVKRRVPHHWVRPVLSRLPAGINDRLVSLWSRRMFDWSRTRYFPMPMDEAGYLRINLCDRERDGIVGPDEYDALCDQIEALVDGLYDETTGEPIAGDILRAWAEASPEAACRRLVPDLVVPWRGPPASQARRLLSKTLPGFAYDVPPRLPSGRSGNHNGNAWFAAKGPGVGRGRTADDSGIVDLVPTVLDYLGVSGETKFEGRPIDLAGRR